MSRFASAAAAFAVLALGTAPSLMAGPTAVAPVAKLKTTPGIAGIHVMGLGRMEPVRRVIEASGLLPRPVAVSSGAG